MQKKTSTSLLSSLLLLSNFFCTTTGAFSYHPQREGPFVIIIGSPIDTTVILVKDRAYYLDKAKRQNTNGWLFGGCALVSIGIGSLIQKSENKQRLPSATALIFGGLSILCTLTSAGFYIAGEVSKHKASVLLKTQKTGFGVPRRTDQSITGISLQIPLGK